MPHFVIGTLEHEKHGELKICFHGPNKNVTLEQYSPEGGRRWINAGVAPKSLLNALEIFEKAKATGDHNKAFSNINLYEFNRDELRAEEERVAKLREKSKRRATYMGAPTVLKLIKMLEDLISEDMSIAQFPVYYGGADWYLHIDKGDRCVIFDEEMLYEDYELDA